MKRTDMVQKLAQYMNEQAAKGYPDQPARADDLLNFLEKQGMEPPEQRGLNSQALSHVYMFPDYNIWDETLEQDERVVHKRRELGERFARRRGCSDD